jgi:hypothetical protein
MHILKDPPQGTIWPHLLEAIEKEVVAHIREYADARMRDVERGAETPALAAVLVDKYGEGMARALGIAGIDSSVQAETDRLVRRIDPDFEQHKKSRWEARPADIRFSAQ